MTPGKLSNSEKERVTHINWGWLYNLRGAIPITRFEWSMELDHSYFLNFI